MFKKSSESKPKKSPWLIKIFTGMGGFGADKFLSLMLLNRAMKREEERIFAALKRDGLM